MLMTGTSPRSTPSTALRAAASAAALAVMTLGLAACGGSIDDPAGSAPESSEQTASPDGADAPADAAVYEFEDLRSAGPTPPPVSVDSAGGPLVVRLSSDLKAATPSDRTQAIEEYTVKSTVFTTGICRIDVEITYAEGGFEALQEPNFIYSGERDPDAPDLDPVTIAYSHAAGNGSSPQLVSALPADDELEDGAVYALEDGSGLTVVDQCSETSDDSLVWLDFPYIERDREETEQGTRVELDTFAKVGIAFMGNGTPDTVVPVLQGEVSGADLSVTGEWTQSG